MPQIPVPQALTPYIQAISVSDPDAAQPSTAYQVLPSLGAVLGFQYRGQLAVQQGTYTERLARGGITGLQETARWFVPDGPTHSVLVRFTSYGAYALFGCPMDELANRHVSLAELVPGVSAIAEQIAERDPQTAAAIVCDWLLTLLARHNRAVHPTVALATEQMIVLNGNAPVAQIAARLGVSRRQLERLFRTQIGVGPKEFASVTRFTWAVAHLAQRQSWTDVALAAGYADQAHFIRSFQRRAGITPGEYVRQFAATTFTNQP